MRPARAGGSACRCRGSTRDEPIASTSPDPRGGGSGGDGRALEVLVARAVVALGERRPLARLPLARRRAAPRDAAVECTLLDLLLDERTGSVDALGDRPRDLRLHRYREVPPNVLEKRAIGLREVLRIRRESLHRPLARRKHFAAVLELCQPVDIGIDEVFDRAVDRSRVLIHAVLNLEDPLVHCVARFSLRLCRNPWVDAVKNDDSDATRWHSTSFRTVLQMFSIRKTKVGRPTPVPAPTIVKRPSDTHPRIRSHARSGERRLPWPASCRCR